MVCYDINRSVPLSPQERAIRKGCSFCVCDPGSHVLSVASLYESAPSGRARIPLSPHFDLIAGEVCDSARE